MRCLDARHKTDKQWSFVARDTWSQAIYAIIVDAKGYGDVDGGNGLKHCITTLGCKIVELKTDGEPAFVDVAKKVKELSEVEILHTNQYAHDPQ